MANKYKEQCKTCKQWTHDVENGTCASCRNQSVQVSPEVQQMLKRAKNQAEEAAENWLMGHRASGKPVSHYVQEIQKRFPKATEEMWWKREASYAFTHSHISQVHGLTQEVEDAFKQTFLRLVQEGVR